MRVFQSKDRNLVEISEKKFDLERTIQNLVEKNLDTIFVGLEYIETELQVGDFKLDTIAFDTERKSFVIIKYKKNENASLIDQRAIHYQLLDDRKEKFVLLYNKKMNKTFNINDINWNETRLIFISSKYAKFQKSANDFQKLPIELYEIKKYQNGIIFLTRVEDTPTPSINSAKSAKVKNALPTYVEEEYLAKKDPTKETKKLWDRLKSAIEKTFENIEFIQKKVYSSYRLKDNDSLICTLEIFKNKIVLTYSTSDMTLLETSEFVQDVSTVGHQGSGNFRSAIINSEDIAKAIPLIEKVYHVKSVDSPTINKSFAKSSKRIPLIQDMYNARIKDAATPSIDSVKSKAKNALPVYAEEDYLAEKNLNEEIKKLWVELKNRIESMFDDVEFKQKKVYSSYRLKGDGHSICTLEACKNKIVLTYSTSDMTLLETSEFVQDVSTIGHYGLGKFRSAIKNSKDIVKAVPLIEKVYHSKK